jgi:hypothetical protein
VDITDKMTPIDRSTPMPFPLPASTLTTVAALQRGDWAAIGTGNNTPVRILRTERMPYGGVWVTWDHGPGTRVTRRMVPGGNPAQVRW